MAKKIMRLTETDLVRLVKKVIKEQELDRELASESDSPIKEIHDTMVHVDGASSKVVSKVLGSLSEKIRFVAILNSEFADFSEIDVCSFPNLMYVNLKGTQNNLEENANCDYIDVGNGLFDFAIEKEL